ncbi:serine hydrolase [Streptomyces sp. NPDC048337]|uniref:D-alanyl-D-alanine carboxypeptidase n=1 Tax=Streptomyces sp. NPDC048337 TaxID=3365535 RepID=UPI00371244A4
MKAVSVAGGSSDTPETDPEAVSAPARRNPAEPGPRPGTPAADPAGPETDGTDEAAPPATEVPDTAPQSAATDPAWAGEAPEHDTQAAAAATTEADQATDSTPQSAGGTVPDTTQHEPAEAGKGPERDTPATAETVDTAAEAATEADQTADSTPQSASGIATDTAQDEPTEADADPGHGAQAAAEAVGTAVEGGGGGEEAADGAARLTAGARAAGGGRKVPSWAREVESDAERTSEFVALKDLDTPRLPAHPEAPATPAANEARTSAATPATAPAARASSAAAATTAEPAARELAEPSATPAARTAAAAPATPADPATPAAPADPATRASSATPAAPADPAARASSAAPATPAEPAARESAEPSATPAARTAAAPAATPADSATPAARASAAPAGAAGAAAPGGAASVPAGATSALVGATPAPGVPVPAAGGPAAHPQPAEPAAALALLAELTNTAPPPETPRRTVLRRVKVWTPILVLLAGAVAGAQMLRPLPTPRLVAAETVHTLPGQFAVPWPAKGQGAVQVPGSGDIGTFGEQKPVPTASVAKVMTAYVVLKGHPLRKSDPGPDITVDAKAVADGTAEHESRIKGLTAGTKFSQQDMLKMLMIPSGNNVARLLARWDTGSDNETAFVEKMNAAARELGMKDTTYTDPSGLDAGTVSTAADQLKLAEAVMKDEAFRTVVAMPNATIKGLPEPIYNNNDLLTAGGLSIRGIKTGSSTPAGGTLMWAAYKSVGDETPLILGTLMDQHVDGPDPDGANSLLLVKANSKKIIEAVREALAAAPVVRKGQTVGYVDDGLGGRTPLVATKDLNTVGVPGQPLRISLAPGTKGLPHTAKAGAEVGVVTVGDGDGAKSVPVAVGGELIEPSFGARLTRLG